MEGKAVDINSGFYGVPVSKLMENAGATVAKHLMSYDKILVFAGKGNNGGDALVAARALRENGKDVKVYVISGEKSKLNQKNLEKLEDYVEISSADDFELDECDAILDGIFGVGFKGELREPLKSIIEKINASNTDIISIDTPSAGKIEADIVISLDEEKVPGAVVEDIGIPDEAKKYAGPGDVQVAIPERNGKKHKGDFGRLIVFGGSKKYIGTPTLVAQAALSSGVDLITVCVPQYVADKMPFDPNLIVHPLKSQEVITKEDVDEVLSMNADAIVFGNGISTEAKEAVEHFMKEVDKPCVIDADAIGVCDKKLINNKMILTPHQGEYKRVFEEKEIDEAAKESGAVIVLKGETDMISDGLEKRMNKSGNPHMTVGGTGDVLAGVIGSLLAQNHELMKSAVAGTFITGFAGDLADQELGVGLKATDVIGKIPEAIKEAMQYDGE